MRAKVAKALRRKIIREREGARREYLQAKKDYKRERSK
jgi:hypothetical protein